MSHPYSNAYSNGGGRQQRKRPRDSDDEHYRRPKPPVDIIQSIKKDLIKLGDPGSITPEEDILYVAKKLATEFEVDANKDAIVHILQECIEQLSIKIPHYATVVLLASHTNLAIGERMIRTAAEIISTASSTLDWTKLKQWLRFMAYADRLLPEECWTLSAVEALVEAIQKYGQDNTSLPNGAVEVCLLTLPYIARNTSIMGPLDAVVETLATMIAPIHEVQHSFKTSLGETKTVLQALHQQCQSASQSSWNVQFVPDFSQLLIDQSVKLADSIATPVFDIKEHSGAISQSYFDLYVDQSIESVPKSTNLAASVLRDLISDTLDQMHYNRKECARFLIDLESYLPRKQFVLRGTPLDKIPETGPSWKAEDIVVEMVFAKLFALPRPVHKPVYYHSVLTELCKLVPQAIAPTFGRAIRNIYNNLEKLEPALAYRFWDWFSHHLSNFGFNWKWQEWVEDLKLPSQHPKLIFIREAIAKECELSYGQKIQSTLPEPYHAPLIVENPAPIFSFASDGHPHHGDAQSLIALLQTRATPETLNAFFEEFVAKNTDERSAISLLTQCILQNGFQSFSHAMDTIEHNLVILRNVCSSSETKEEIMVEEVMAFWRQRPFIASTILQKLTNYRVLQPASIMRYLLGEKNADHLPRSITWELMESTMDKVDTRQKQAKERWELVRALAQTGDQIDPEVASAHDGLDAAFVEQKTLYSVLQSHLSLPSTGDWGHFWKSGLSAEFERQVYLRVPGLASEHTALSGELIEEYYAEQRRLIA